MHYDLDTDSSDYLVHRKSSKRNLIVCGIFFSAVGLGLGVLVGYFSRGSCTTCQEPCLGSTVPSKIIEDADPTIREKIFQEIKAENIRENLRKWTTYPHLGGTEGEDRLAEEIYDIWTSQGMDHVEKLTYDVLLSYPEKSDPSQVFLLDENDNVIFESQKEEKILRPEQNHSDVVPPFNAYSPPGEKTALLVYVNYGRIEDFKFLKENLSIDLNGTIAIARYGKIFRAHKVMFAEQYGAVGMILYSDPADYSVEQERVYPDTWWLPPTGVQRGTVYPFDGDPLTPGYPSLATAYRYPEAETSLPKILAHPISYGDAHNLLINMTGPEVPSSWRGGLNITYRLGPGYTSSGWKVKMHISTHNERRNTTNVIGYIKGSVEPDRYVMLGNHRDAWVFGAIDPTSGTAAMMEVSRVLTSLVKKGWRPRRSIMFCSWGAEEYALVGSYEYVENFVKNLGSRAVAMLNVDLVLQGNHTMRGLGVPILYDAMYEVAQLIETPNKAGKSLYDEWIENYPRTNPEGKNVPSIGGLGAGSDYAPFMILAGVPSLDVRFTYDRNLPINGYPLYHSVYETFHLVETYMDRDFKFSEAIAKYWGEMARYLADSLVLPLNGTKYAIELREYVDDLEKGYGNLMKQNGIILDNMYAAVDDLITATKAFHDRLKNVNTKNPVEVRLYNDQLMALERAFLDPEGLPSRTLYKHVLFAPSQNDAYAGATFPGLVDLMFDIEGSPNAAERWEGVRRHLAALIFCIKSAATVMAPVTEFGS